jgi:hypothetical protein
MHEVIAPADAGPQVQMHDYQQSVVQPEHHISTEVISQKAEKYSTAKISSLATATLTIQEFNMDNPPSPVKDTHVAEIVGEDKQSERDNIHSSPRHAQISKPIHNVDVAARHSVPSQWATSASDKHSLPFIIRERSAEPEGFTYRPAPDLVANTLLYQRPTPGLAQPMRSRIDLVVPSAPVIDAGR